MVAHRYCIRVIAVVYWFVGVMIDYDVVMLEIVEEMVVVDMELTIRTVTRCLKQARRSDGRHPAARGDDAEGGLGP